MKITISKTLTTDLPTVWDCWNRPEDIMQWNAASDDWHTTSSRVDLREGGTFSSRMEAKDGSMGFDFSGTYTRIVPHELIEYSMDDGRVVTVLFGEHDGVVTVTETFDAEDQNPPDLQRQGWQAILDNFARFVQSRPK